MSDSYVLQVDWSEPKLPRLVGPFGTRDEAEGWAAVRIVNGEWNVALVAPPVGPALRAPSAEELARTMVEDLSWREAERILRDET